MGTRYGASLAACVRLAGAQHGVIGRLQARATGLSADAIQRLVQTDRWRRVHPSVYALWVPPEPEQRRRHVLMGAVLWLGGRAAVSGKAAALDWGLDGIDEAR